MTKIAIVLLVVAFSVVSATAQQFGLSDPTTVVSMSLKDLDAIVNSARSEGHASAYREMAQDALRRLNTQITPKQSVPTTPTTHSADPKN
jgi:hypothetical protein